MKRIILLTCLILSAYSTQANKVKAKHALHVHVLSTRLNIFYFKVHKKLIGAEVEVYDTHGVKLISQKITYRKILVDFHYEEAGEYFIKIKQGQLQEEFDFIKTELPPENLNHDEMISVTQGV